MAEDTCRNGRHPRSDVYVYPDGHRQCRSCKREATYRYLASEKGRAANTRYQASDKYRVGKVARDARYNNSLKGYVRSRDWELKRSRAHNERRLADLAAEEARWATRSGTPLPTR